MSERGAEHIVDRAVKRERVESQIGEECSLRVKVEEQDAPPVFPERRAQVDRGSGFADAALLLR